MKKIFLLLIAFSSIVAAQKTPFEESVFIHQSGSLPYRIMAPKKIKKNQKYPLFLFLHGAGERGQDNSKQLIHGSKLIGQRKIRKKYPAYVVFPQCPSDDYWANVQVNKNTSPYEIYFDYQQAPTQALSLVMKLLDSLLQNPNIDPSRVYVAGLSMGGMGTFELIYRRPKVFAAAIPICGGGDPKHVVPNIPTWIVHGAQDDVVDPKLSLQMADALLKAGGTPRISFYENYKHNSWDGLFADPNFIPWLFKQRKSN